jgi:hypothetical protein
MSENGHMMMWLLMGFVSFYITYRSVVKNFEVMYVKATANIRWPIHIWALFCVNAVLTGVVGFACWLCFAMVCYYLGWVR